MHALPALALETPPVQSVWCFLVVDMGLSAVVSSTGAADMDAPDGDFTIVLYTAPVFI